MFFDDSEHENENFQEEGTIDELKNAALKSSNTTLFDVTMIKDLDDKALFSAD